MERLLIYTEEDSETPKECPDKKLEIAIKEKYDFQVGYFPGGYPMVMLLLDEDKNSSAKDKWKTVFFKRRRKLNGTITLDNMEELEGSSSYEYDFYKEIDGNFEDVIDFVADNIKIKIKSE